MVSSAGNDSSPPREGGRGTGRAHAAEIPAATEPLGFTLTPLREGGGKLRSDLSRAVAAAILFPLPPCLSPLTSTGSGARPPHHAPRARPRAPPAPSRRPGSQVKGRGFGTGPGSPRGAAAARKVKGDGMSAWGGRRLRRRVGSALTGKRLGGAMGGWVVEEAWSIYGRGHVC